MRERAPTVSPGAATSYQRDEFGRPAYSKVRRKTLISSSKASWVCLRPWSGARADWKVISATPSILRSRGIAVFTPLIAGHRPGLSASRWICRAWGGRDDSGVGAFPVVHAGLAGLVGAHPQQDRG